MRGLRSTCAVLSAAIVLFLARPARGQTDTPNVWTPLGPSGGNVSRISAHPTDPAKVDVATAPGTVFHSRDGGQSWERKVLFYPQPGVFAGEFADTIDGVLRDSSNPDVLLAWNTLWIWRSADGGDSWTALHAPDDVNPPLIYDVALASTGRIYAATLSGLLATDDQGASWTTVFRPYTRSVTTVAVAPSDPNVVYAGIFANLFRSSDAGHTFTLVPNFFTEPRRIFVDPSNSSVAFAITSRFSGLLRTRDGWATWMGISGNESQDLAFDPAHPGTLLLATAKAGIFRSTDGGDTWSPISTGLTNPSGSSVAVASGRIYAGFGGAGAFRSDDTGAGWQDLALPSATVGQLAATPASAGFLAGSVYGVGIAKSTSRGASWSFTTPPRLNFQDFAVSPFDARTVVTATDDGLFVTEDGGTTWNDRTPAPADAFSYDLAAFDPVDRATIYSFSFPGALAFYRSSDLGRTWTSLPNGGDLGFAWSLRVDESDRQKLFALTANFYPLPSPGGVMRSVDGGATWTDATPPDGNGPFFYFGIFLLPSPRRLSVWNERGGFVSADDGKTWFHLGEPPARYTASVTSSPDGSALYAAGYCDGVFKSVDGGLTWWPIVSGLGSRCVNQVLVDPVDRSWIYAGTDNGGVLRMKESPPSIESVSPASGPASGGTTVTLRGSGFGPGARVQFGSNPPAPAAVLDPLTLSATTPQNIPETVDVQVVTAGGQPAIRRDAFAYTGECTPSPSVLCLNGGRFSVRAHWRTSEPQSGEGSAVALTGDTGYFWFFSSNNVELVVKVVDGRGFNGRFWVFSGALSNVQYSIEVTDTTTGATKTYENPNGALASFADTAAF